MTYTLKLATLLSLGFLVSCTSTRYIEKQSEPLKQAVYGVSDSLKEARIDLAWFYSNETTKLVGPPLKRLSIKPLYETTTSTNSVGERILVIPEELKHTKVIVIGSSEYQELLKNKEIAQQVTEELKLQKEITQVVDKQRQVNEQNQLKLIDDYNKAQLTIQKKDAAIWFRNFVILGLLVLIGGYVGLRVAIAYGKVTAPFIL